MHLGFMPLKKRYDVRIVRAKDKKIQGTIAIELFTKEQSFNWQTNKKQNTIPNSSITFELYVTRIEKNGLFK